MFAAPILILPINLTPFYVNSFPSLDSILAAGYFSSNRRLMFFPVLLGLYNFYFGDSQTGFVSASTLIGKKAGDLDIIQLPTPQQEESMQILPAFIQYLSPVIFQDILL
jgi:hypothetical protein